jgi:hypothetical protein
VNLLPWSPFPCSFNSKDYAGKSDQNITDWCYGQAGAADKPSGPEFKLARSLTTDGYSNVFTGEKNVCEGVGGRGTVLH